MRHLLAAAFLSISIPAWADQPVSFAARDDGFVDVAFTLFLGGRFNVEIDEFLTIDNGDTEFFRLCRIEEHAFHCFRAPAHFGTLQRNALAGSDFSLSGCVHVRDEGKGDWKVLINKRPRVYY